MKTITILTLTFLPSTFLAVSSFPSTTLLYHKLTLTAVALVRRYLHNGPRYKLESVCRNYGRAYDERVCVVVAVPLDHEVEAPGVS